MIRTLVTFAVFAALTCSCGAPEPVDVTTSALNGHSTPPPGGFPTDCVGAYPLSWHPMSATWPAHGFCQWQPTQVASPWPYHVSSCWGPAPAELGSMWIYSGPNFTGQCAAISGGGVWPGYQFDVDVVQANGWLSIWTQRFTGTPMMVNIQSFRIAPSTDVLFCEGPLTGPGGAPCNQYRMQGFGTQGQGINYPSVFYSDGSPYTIAAIQIGSSY